MMSPESIGDISREMIILMVKVAGPVLVVALVVGVIISLIQTLTQIQEQTLTFLPKMAAILTTILVLGTSFYRMLTQFTEKVWRLMIG